MLKIGDKAPDFELRDTNGNLVRLSKLKGKEIVLYFYPKDLTPGCTVEACNFRDDYNDYNKKGVLVFGVSLDNEERHKKFTEKYDLPFPLLSDAEIKVSKAYGVYGEKSFLGKKYFGINRTTFVIDKKGFIKHVFEKVNPKNHSKEVLGAI